MCGFPPDDLNEEDLMSIERRLKASSPGPWRHRSHGFIESGIDGDLVIGVTCQGHDECLERLPSADNAEFIAHARQDVPALLAEVRHLRERVAELEAALRSASRPMRERVG
jgi:hypothetical protein